RHGARPKTFALVRGGSRFHPCTLPGRAGFLARVDFYELWLVRPYKLYGNRSTLRVRTFSCRCNLPNSGIGQTVRGTTPDFQHAATRRAHAFWQITHPVGARKRNAMNLPFSRLIRYFPAFLPSGATL